MKDSESDSFPHLSAVVVFNQNGGEDIETAEYWNMERTVP